eukprot:COSAG06_NODE_12391_length_1388_cov_1.213344_2_plen_136_part_01
MQANVSNGFLGQPGPSGSTWSSDGFYYTPLDNLTQIYAQVNRCGEREQGQVYETAHDGQLYWHCMQPFGDGCESGASVVRCSSLADHVWPSFEDPVRKETRALFGSRFCTEKRSFCQDRLGTNIGKKLREKGVCCR